MAQIVKNLPTMWETRVQSQGWEDTLDKGMATHSSIHACLENSMDRGAKTYTHARQFEHSLALPFFGI